RPPSVTLFPYTTLFRSRGSDLRYDMEIKLEEAAFGANKEIEIEKLDTCDKCQGSGAEPGSRKISCPTCGGRGQVVSSRGFFHIRSEEHTSELQSLAYLV